MFVFVINSQKIEALELQVLEHGGTITRKTTSKLLCVVIRAYV